MIGLPIARVLGIEIRVQLAWVLILALIGVMAVTQINAVDPGLSQAVAWVLGGAVAFGFFVSSVVHDLAHALVARRRGVDVGAIVVSFFGGATPLEPTAPDPRDDFAIAASGPLASLGVGALLLLLAGVVVAIEGQFGAAAGVLAVLVFLNLVLGLVNLVPAYPLDGGRIVRALAWRRTGSETVGSRAAALSGRLTGFAVIGAGLVVLFLDASPNGAMLALTGWFLVLTANALRERVKLDELVGHHVVADAMEADPASVPPNVTVDLVGGQLLERGAGAGAIAVVRGDEVIGVLGAAQVRRLGRAASTTRVEDVMAPPSRFAVVAPTEPLRTAMERLHRSGLEGAPVLDEGRLVGMLTRRSIARLLRDDLSAAKSGTTGRPPGVE